VTTYVELEEKRRTERRIRALEATLPTAQLDITNLQGDVSTLQGNVLTLQGDVSTLQGDVSALQTTVGSLSIVAFSGDYSNLINLPTLGTAAALNVVTSDTDVTAGRLITTNAGPAQAFRRGNIIGTVSESGGVPTGAVIQTGSNSDGVFTRYADGTMVCTHEMGSLGPINTTMGGGSRSARYTWTYPSPFASAPIVSVTANRNNVDPPAPNSSLSGVTSTTASYWLTYMGSTAVTSFRAQLIAIGRWY